MAERLKSWETYDEQFDPHRATLALGGIHTLGIERETAALAMTAQPPLQLPPKSASDELLRLDTSELPEWAQMMTAGPTLAWRYLRPGYQLTVTTQQHQPAEVLQALLDLRINGPRFAFCG